MRDDVARVLDAAEEALAERLVARGLDRAAARALVYLAAVGEAPSPAIERATGLRSPDASRALQRLKTKGLAAVRREPTGARGRPVNRWRATGPLEAALERAWD